MSSALGHVRNYIAGQSQDESSNFSIQRFVVKRDSDENGRRKEARKARQNRCVIY
jgi:hypothetical protein